MPLPFLPQKEQNSGLMGSLLQMGVLAVFAILASLMIVGVHGGCDNSGKWSKPLNDLMDNQHEMLKQFYAVMHPTPVVIKKYRNFLKSFKPIAKAFLDADLKDPVLNNDCFSMILNTISFRFTLHLSTWNLWIDKNRHLVTNFRNRYIFAEKRMKKSIKDYKSTSGPTKAYVLPVKTICNGMPSRKFQKEISIKDVCPDMSSCAPTAYPYGPGIPVIEKPFTVACTSDKKCNLNKAFPLMVGIHWAAVHDWMAEKLCPNSCKGGKCNVTKTYEKLIHETNLLLAYVNVYPQVWGPIWQSFFDDALKNDAFLNVEESVALVDENMDIFDTTPTACSDLSFTDACIYADIYKEYIMIKKVQNYRKQPGLIRDFRHMPNIDFKIRLRQERDTLNHLQLLGKIKALDKNLKASVSGISDYFKELAKYDRGIADADAAFIRSKLTKYEKDLTDVENELNLSLKALLDKTIVLVGAKVADKLAMAAAKIAENSNPLKLFFGGLDVSEILGLGGEIADAATEVIKASALLRNFNELVKDSSEIQKAFTGNKEQLEGLKEVVDKIKSSSDKIDKDGEKFLKAYAGYTPQTDRSALEKNNALWSAFGGAACDLVNGNTGIGSSIPKGVVANQLLCEKYKGALAQFFALREGIFDFQFQLVDAVAAVVRGNIAKRLAEGIKGKGDVLHATQLLIGSFKMHNKFQSTASLACDVLQYQLQGKQNNKACATTNGLFVKKNLDALIDHSFTASTTENTKDVYIPTGPSFDGDTGYIDLQAMAKGQTVVFKLPTDSTWLRENGWITSGQTDMPFVKDIKLFLPQKKYKTGDKRQETTTTIKLSSIAGSFVSLAPSKKDIAYILPNRHTVYKTQYKEGYTTCSATEINNPYSLCGNLPKICQTTTRAPGSLALYPTILSTWSLTYTIEQGAQLLKWKAPKPASNLLIHAKVTLIPSIQPQQDMVTKRSKVNTVTSKNGCCDGNRYRISRFNNECAECPANSRSKLRGYYCELNKK